MFIACYLERALCVEFPHAVWPFNRHLLDMRKYQLRNTPRGELLSFAEQPDSPLAQRPGVLDWHLG